MTEMFNGIKIYLHPDGIIKARKKILETQFTKNGGVLIENLSELNEKNLRLNYILIDDDLDLKRARTVKLNKDAIGDAKVLRTKWLSNCVKQKTLITETKPYEVKLNDESDAKINRLDLKSDKSDIKNGVSISKNERNEKKNDEKSTKIERNGRENETDRRKNELDVYQMTTESSSSSSEDEQKFPKVDSSR